MSAIIDDGAGWTTYVVPTVEARALLSKIDSSQELLRKLASSGIIDHETWRELAYCLIYVTSTLDCGHMRHIDNDGGSALVYFNTLKRGGSGQ